MRQSLFIRMLLISFATLGFSAVERETYIRHHRDWLVRFLITKAKSPEVSPESILAPLRERTAAIGPTVSAIRQLLEATASKSELHPMFATWQRCLEAFFAYVSTFRGDKAYDLDPYTDDYSFLPLFKLLQGACNQLGLRLKSELYVYHLLLTAAVGEEV